MGASGAAERHCLPDGDTGPTMHDQRQSQEAQQQQQEAQWEGREQQEHCQNQQQQEDEQWEGQKLPQLALSPSQQQQQQQQQPGMPGSPQPQLPITIRCSCAKSRCLKLYCNCLASGRYQSPDMACLGVRLRGW